ncbi:MAG: hypothetical protein Q7J57_01860 [Gemmobacter sp.]|nr:hypothetical protein [Gemmobacter sp.]
MSMVPKPKSPQGFNLVIVAQAGRLQYEAVIFAASLAATNPGMVKKLFIAEPQPGPRWRSDPRIPDAETRALLEGFGATILPFENLNFGSGYPYGNKIDALMALPEGEPFVFFDTDTLVAGDLAAVRFDFDRPSASGRVEGTWPVPELYGPGYTGIWKSLFDRFGLEFDSTLDLRWPDEYWRRYLYFNAGWFFFRCPREFGARFAEYATEIRREPGDALAAQSLNPWLDQVALPLVIHSFGGGRAGPELAGLDGAVTCHYRALPLLYARESDAVVDLLEQVTAPNQVKRVMRGYEPAKKLIYQRKGAKIRALFDRNDLPRREQMIRNTIKREGLWLR